jgi:ParB-like chromosome segregation protein Spo0J
MKTIPIGGIKPYWNNPRQISDEAVNTVAASIERFGYVQPIVVDS